MREWLLRQLNGYFFGFVWFLIGVAVGVVLVMAFYAVNCNKARKESKVKFKPVDIEALKAKAAAEFLDAGTDLDFKAKTNVTIKILNNLCEEINNKYYFPEIKKFTFLDKVPGMNGGIKTNCEFSFYELLNFFDEFLYSLQDGLEEVLEGKEFMSLFGTYRLINKKIGRDPKETKMSVVYCVFFQKKEEPPVTETKKSFLSKLKKAVVNSALKMVKPMIKHGFKMLQPTIIRNIDKFFVTSLINVADDVNLLYSGNLTDERAIK